MIEEFLVHCGWDQSWAGGSGFYNKTGWRSHLKQASISGIPSWPQHLLLPPGSCLDNSVPSSFGDEQWCSSASQIDPSLLMLRSSWCFIPEIETLSTTRTKTLFLSVTVRRTIESFRKRIFFTFYSILFTFWSQRYHSSAHTDCFVLLLTIMWRHVLVVSNFDSHDWVSHKHLCTDFRWTWVFIPLNRCSGVHFLCQMRAECMIYFFI